MYSSFNTIVFCNQDWTSSFTYFIYLWHYHFYQ